MQKIKTSYVFLCYVFICKKYAKISQNVQFVVTAWASGPARAVEIVIAECFVILQWPLHCLRHICSERGTYDPSDPVHEMALRVIYAIRALIRSERSAIKT